MATYALTEKAAVLRSEDDVTIAKKELTVGMIREDGPVRIEVRPNVRPGHKVARRPRVHGHPGARPRVDHRPGGRRVQRHLLHDGTRSTGGGAPPPNLAWESLTRVTCV